MVGGRRVSLKRAECRAMYNRKRNHLLAYSELLRGAIHHLEDDGTEEELRQLSVWIIIRTRRLRRAYEK